MFTNRHATLDTKLIEQQVATIENAEQYSVYKYPDLNLTNKC